MPGVTRRRFMQMFAGAAVVGAGVATGLITAPVFVEPPVISALDLSRANMILKEYYLDAINAELHRQTVLSRRLDNCMVYEGREFSVPLHIN